VIRWHGLSTCRVFAIDRLNADSQDVRSPCNWISHFHRNSPSHQHLCTSHIGGSVFSASDFPFKAGHVSLYKCFGFSSLPFAFCSLVLSVGPSSHPHSCSLFPVRVPVTLLLFFFWVFWFHSTRHLHSSCGFTASGRCSNCSSPSHQCQDA
jgi:hypothetical protein